LIRTGNVGPRTFDRSFAIAQRAGRLERLPEFARRGATSRPQRIPNEMDVRAELEASAKLACGWLAPRKNGYPPRLAEMDDAPPRSACAATRCDDAADDRDRRSRNASAAGLSFAGVAGAQTCRTPAFVVTSGLAAASIRRRHRVLDRGPATVAVLAGGHDRIYPPEHTDLLHDLIVAGRLRSRKCHPATWRVPMIFQGATGWCQAPRSASS